MKNDILQGKWKDTGGQSKEWWNNFTDDDLDRIQGKMDKLASALQGKYGQTREEASEEIDRCMKEYDQKHGGQR